MVLVHSGKKREMEKKGEGKTGKGRGSVGVRVVSVRGRGEADQGQLFRVYFYKREGSLLWNLLCLQAVSWFMNSFTVM